VKGTADCNICDGGKYQSLEGQSFCDVCVFGKFKTFPSIDDCSACEPGRFTSNVTSPYVCVECNPGYSQPQSGQSVCEGCEAGKFMNISGSDSQECYDCPIGTIAEWASNECASCSSKFEYQQLAGQALCIPCPEYSVASENKSSCVCKAGFYAVDDCLFGDLCLMYPGEYEIYGNCFEQMLVDCVAGSEMLCVPCPLGANCSSDGTTANSVQPEAGFFVGPDSTGVEFFACLNDQCLGGGRCAEHYTGFACTECDGDGLVLNTDYSCSQCLSKALTVFCILCAITAYILYIIYSVES